MSLSRRVAFALVSLLIVTTLPAAAQGLSPRSAASPVLPASPPQAPEGACPPSAILFTQGDSQTIEDFLGISCSQQPPSPQYHRQNSWWRVFRPKEEFGVLGPVQICEIQFGVESSVTPGGTGQPITFNVGVSLDQPFPDGFRYQIGSVSTTLPDLTKQIFILPVNIQIPSGAEVYIEAQVADGLDAQYVLFPGANSQPEGSPSYLSSTDCDIEEPVTMAEIGFPDSHLVFNFRGVEIPIVPTQLEFDGDPTYVVEVGDTTTAGTAWTSFFPAPTPVSSTFVPVYASGTLSASMPDAAASYGTMAPGLETSCVSSGDCSTLAVNGVKTPGAHEDVYIREGTLADKIWDIHVAPTFPDVPASNPFYRYIETIVHHGVTAGCGGGQYCPTSTTIRQQMAPFVLKAREGLFYLPPPCGSTPMFSDVPASNPFCRFIEELARRGVVAGCGGGNYCPTNPVTREQMAVFVLKTLDPAIDPPACVTPIFNDVPASSPFCRFIEELANRGVVTGCGNQNYCPTNPVNRQQMGVFLSGTFSLSLYGP